MAFEDADANIDDRKRDRQQHGEEVSLGRVPGPSKDAIKTWSKPRYQRTKILDRRYAKV